MTQRMLHRAAGLCLAVAMAASAYGQGLVWESTTSGGPLGDKVVTSVQSYMPKMFKTMANEDARVMIFRIDKELLYTVNPSEKTYSVVTFAEMEQQMKKMGANYDAKMEETRKQMEAMPEDQRKMMEKMMGGMMGGKKKDAKFDIAKTSEKRSIAGYNTTKFVISQDGKEAVTLWATKDLSGFDAMRKDMTDFSKRMSGMNPMMSKGLVETMQKVEGFPLETEISGVKNVVTKVERKNTPVSEFEVPAGYTKVKSEFLQEEKSKD